MASCRSRCSTISPSGASTCSSLRRRPFGRDVLHGWYAHLEADQNDGRQELRLLLDKTLGEGSDGSDLLQPIALHLKGDLRSAIHGFTTEALRMMEQDPRLTDEERTLLTNHVEVGELERELLSTEPLVSTLLYICSSAGEILARGTGQAHPRLRGLRRAGRSHPSPGTWACGWAPLWRRRLLAPIATAPRGTGTHASPRGHVRRAHWHSFWTGPRADAAKRKIELRWLPPIPVNLDLGGIVPTVHEVL